MLDDSLQEIYMLASDIAYEHSFRMDLKVYDKRRGVVCYFYQMFNNRLKDIILASNNEVRRNAVIGNLSFINKRGTMTYLVKYLTDQNITLLHIDRVVTAYKRHTTTSYDSERQLTVASMRFAGASEEDIKQKIVDLRRKFSNVAVNRNYDKS
jgi:hypothetical protein